MAYKILYWVCRWTGHVWDFVGEDRHTRFFKRCGLVEDNEEELKTMDEKQALKEVLEYLDNLSREDDGILRKIRNEQDPVETFYHGIAWGRNEVCEDIKRLVDDYREFLK